MQINIDSEFKSLIPPLTAEEYAGLETSILSDGCRDAIVLWDDTIVDGHNRYEICTRHDIPFDTVEMDFANRDEAMLWMIDNQKARRNLTAYAIITLNEKAGNIQARRKKNQGTRTDLFVNSQKGYTPVNVTKELAKKSSVGEQAASRVIQINKAIEKAIENETTVVGQKPEELKNKLMSGDISINQAYKDIKREELRREREEVIQEQIERPKTSNHIDIYTTENKYRVIYADPPWSYNDKQNIEVLGGAEKHYPTMPLDEICALPIPAEDNAVLFIWVTSPLLEDSFKVINAWGFKYKSSFVWDKVAHNMGHYNSVRHEFLLIATKGSCTPDVKRLFDSVVSIERTEHSRKPNEFREMISTLYPFGGRLEMFAREAPEGWDVWGNMA